MCLSAFIDAEDYEAASLKGRRLLAKVNVARNMM
jgi:hypothetical protein